MASSLSLPFECVNVSIKCQSDSKRTDLGIGVTEFDGDVSLELVLVSDDQETGDWFSDGGGLFLCHLTDDMDAD